MGGEPLATGYRGDLNYPVRTRAHPEILIVCFAGGLHDGARPRWGVSLWCRNIRVTFTSVTVRVPALKYLSCAMRNDGFRLTSMGGQAPERSNIGVTIRRSSTSDHNEVILSS